MRATIKKILLAALLPVALAPTAGCASYKLEPPDGFVQVSKWSRELHLKAQDNVGLSLKVFKNVQGGSLDYWGADLVKKLGLRGYHLIAQEAVKSKNGVEGTRFDFEYTAEGSDEPKFYVAVLFTTDEWKFVLQLAGNKALAPTYKARVADIVGDLKVRGCKAASKICKGPQPPRLSTPPPTVEAGGDAKGPVTPTEASPTTPTPTPTPASATPAG
ncbi:MAG: hypothetical protein R3B09_27450 [Nannocystaceae bacterium]